MAAEQADNELSDLQLVVEHMQATECRMPSASPKGPTDGGPRAARRLRGDWRRARAARRRAARRFGRILDVARA